MLPHFEGKYEPKQNNIDFESAREVLMKEDDKMVLKRHFERINKMIACKSCIKYEDTPEKTEIFIYGSKHFKTDKIVNYIFIGCESNELFENDKLFNFWSNENITKDTEKIDFRITRRSFMTLVKRNIFF